MRMPVRQAEYNLQSREVRYVEKFDRAGILCPKRIRKQFGFLRHTANYCRS